MTRTATGAIALISALTCGSAEKIQKCNEVKHRQAQLEEFGMHLVNHKEAPQRMKQIAWMVMVFLAGAQVFAQEGGSAQSAAVIGSTDEMNAPESPLQIIFSNLGPRSDPYNTEALWVSVAGKESSTDPEQWQAVRFSPKVDVQAKVLTAALQYVSGVRLVKLGLYDNNDVLNTVGTLLPGGEGSTTEIPDLDDCCQLAKVTLDGAGVTLFAGELYWLVISSDDISGSSFTGRWRLSKLPCLARFPRVSRGAIYLANGQPRKFAERDCKQPRRLTWQKRLSFP